MGQTWPQKARPTRGAVAITTAAGNAAQKMTRAARIVMAISAGSSRRKKSGASIQGRPAANNSPRKTVRQTI